MHGEEHVGNATYLIIQALFTANSDYYQINWHFWLDGENHLLVTIMHGYYCCSLSIGSVFFLQAIILHVVYHLKGKIQLLLLTKYLCVQHEQK